MSPAPGPAGNVVTNMLSVSGHFHVDGGFQPTIDWDWQKEELARERNAERDARETACGPEGCPIPQ